MIIYLSGPISGVPDYNRPAFEDAKAHIQAMPGWTSPLDLRSPLDFCADLPDDWHIRMRRCVAEVTASDMVVNLDRWWLSPGAIIENRTARDLKIPVKQIVSVPEHWEEGTKVPFYWRLDDLPQLTDNQLGEMPLDLWWAAMADRELALTIPKCMEYGDDGDDLVAIGSDIDMIIHRGPPAGVSAGQWESELGIFFYLRGKLARMLASYKKGRLPSMDTYFDSNIYSKMLQRVRMHGLWK